MVTVYLDDILVSEHSYEKAHGNLLRVLRKLQDSGLCLRREKCSFMMKSCIYLGHRLDGTGVHPTEEKTAAIVNFPISKNVSDLSITITSSSVT